MMKFLFLAVLLLAAAVVIGDRLHLRRQIARLDAMLGRAIRGEFQEETFDESRLSALETRLAHYLSASAISANRVAEEKETIKTLIADISHQTKTPIANLCLYAQLLSELDLPEEGAAYAAALEAQTQKLRALIEDLIKLSRLETGILSLNPRRAPLETVLEESAAQLLPKAEGKQLTLTLTPTEEWAVFDPKWTGEALCNLLDNAVKYTPSGGRITLSVQSYALFCRIDVSDTGPGIPEAEQSKIFQRFYRSAAAQDEEGVGIGLYLVRQICRDQGGYVKVRSRPGEGSTFSLFLPRD